MDSNLKIAEGSSALEKKNGMPYTEWDGIKRKPMDFNFSSKKKSWSGDDAHFYCLEKSWVKAKADLCRINYFKFNVSTYSVGE